MEGVTFCNITYVSKTRLVGLEDFNGPSDKHNLTLNLNLSDLIKYPKHHLQNSAIINLC